MKNKHKNHTKSSKPVLVMDEYFVQKLRARFSEIPLDRVDEVIAFSKRYTPKSANDCPFKVVANKLRNPQYSDSVYLVNPKYNLIMVAVSNVLLNVLYLDGKDGYNLI
jgi:hypothetical protein